MKATTKYLMWLLCLMCMKNYCQQLHKLPTHELINRQCISKIHTNEFASLQVQDFQGRIKPIHTLALDLLRKIYGKDTYKYIDEQGSEKKLQPVQVFLGMQFKPDSWQLLPCIKVEKKLIDTISKFISISKKGYAKPAEFFDFQGNYKLKPLVTAAFAKAEGKRNVLDKNIIKLDERLNIVWAIFNGQFLKLFPKPFDVNKKWFAPREKVTFSDDNQLFYEKIIPTYLTQLQLGVTTQNWEKANETVLLLKSFQEKNAPNLLIPSKKVELEISYNKQHIFLKAMIFYSIIGLFLLVIGFLTIFFTKKWLFTLGNIGLVLLISVFIYHGYGIGLRWYISGHAPWTNGYEATIFISWITILAGIIFSRKTKLPAASTALVALCLMGIAHGSLMNPEITNLVPVLKSYWLLIHVAVITGSYGFLTMGSILALLVLILMLFSSKKTKHKIVPKIIELTQINEKTTNIGLCMLTIGTFLGGVWANESWGRYWGWDPKETWALISIVIYAFVLHIRIIFKKEHLLVYNIVSLFALSSLIMTFFGVNYYLSGLHSYAKGDPVPIPFWVYIAIPILILLSILSSYKWKKEY